MKKQKAERVVFLEFEDEVEFFLGSISTNRGQELKDTIIIALSLSVQLALKSKNIPYINSVSFFNNQSHADALKKSEIWLQLLESHLNSAEVLNKELIYCIRMVFNYLLWLSEVIVRAIDFYQPSIICCCDAKISTDSSKWSLTPKDRFLGFILKELSHKKRITIQHLNDASSFTDSEPFVISIQHRDDFRIINSFFSKRMRKILKKIALKNNILLAASCGYGMNKAIEKLGMKSIPSMVLDFEIPKNRFQVLKRIIKLQLFRLKKYRKRFEIFSIPVRIFPFNSKERFILNESIKKELLSITHRIKKEWKNTFINHGVELATCISAKICSGILNHLLELNQLRFQLNCVLELIKPKIVLSPFSSGIYTILGEFCRQKNIPGILIPHGGLAKPQNQLDEIEWRRLSQGLILSRYPFSIAQTPLEKAHAEYFGVSNKTFNTGPVLFSKVNLEIGNEFRKKMGISPNTFVILYAIGQRQRSSMRFHIFQTEDEWLASTVDVIQAINQLQDRDVHLIIKLHPAFRFPETQIRLLLPQCNKMSIMRQEPFSQVLSSVDLMVSSISTTVEESLVNHIPVILYDKWNRYFFINGFNCKQNKSHEWSLKSVYCINQLNILVELLKHFSDKSLHIEKKTKLFKPFEFDENESYPLNFFVEKLIGGKIT